MSYADRKRIEGFEKDGERHEAEQFPCPGCHAAEGETCHHDDGVPLGKAPAHHQRIALARASRPASGRSRSNEGE
ncbi:zinc finger domain-containing protein [Amycolatopsis palatopharyngis]|uniref:zinc finger domain-containing protein n=1 Tax=Amycolatopsis palatopharyngis TaxID=187982 RepID=UPI000E243FF2|nr:hypothetical protein [Amycolatopsis palatopharyngis]